MKRMYHIHTNASELKDSAFRFITTQDFKTGATGEGQNPERLRAIADLSFDLLSQVQKWEKLHKLNQLSAQEQAEYFSTIRLVGIMVHILNEYNYTDKEMTDALRRRYQRYEAVVRTAAA